MSATLERKLGERALSLEPLLRPGCRVLEVGCAEGALGQRLKQRCALFYAGIELSNDADLAGQVLDRVYRIEASAIADADFDLIVSFHVLEHIADVARELGAWRKLLAPGGRVVVEVPNEAGHPLLSWDALGEHLHLFSAPSLAAALRRADFEIERLESGHFESAAYADSLRAFARPRRSQAERRAELVRRIAACAGGPFFVWGAGGDFRNYLAPVLSALPVLGVFDQTPSTHGRLAGDVEVMAFDRSRLADHRVLVCSLRFHDEIVAQLAAAGVPERQCFGLGEIFDGDGSAQRH